MLTSVAGEIDQAQQDALHDIFAQHPRKMLERTANPIGLTLIRGDPNPGNILSPIQGQQRASARPSMFHESGGRISCTLI